MITYTKLPDFYKPIHPSRWHKPTVYSLYMDVHTLGYANNLYRSIQFDHEFIVKFNCTSIEDNFDIADPHSRQVVTYH